MASSTLLADLFRTIDARDSAAFVRFLTPDVRFRFGSAPAVTGQDAVQQAVTGFFSSIKALSHRLLSTWEQGDALIVQGEVTYTRHDGSQITLPFANIFRIQNKLINEYLVYADLAPLFQAPT